MTGKLFGIISGNKPNSSPDSDTNNDEERKSMLHGGEKGLRHSRDSRSRRTLPNWIQQRYLICILAHLGFLLLYMMRSNLSVAIVQMTRPYVVYEVDHLVSRIDFDWSMEEQGFLLSSFFIGYILTQIPGGYFAAKWGGRKVFGLGILSAAVVSCFTPLIGKWLGFYGFMLARIMCGMCEGVTYPAIHAMWTHWTTPADRSSLVSFAFSGAYLGAAISMALDVSSDSWQHHFYLAGFYSILWCALWFAWGGETPESDSLISEYERMILAEANVTSTEASGLPVPWKEILSSPAVWAINSCHFAANWVFYTILTELPTILTDGFHYEGRDLNVAASSCFLAMAFSSALGGLIADNTIHRIFDTTWTRKVTVCVSFIFLHLNCWLIHVAIASIINGGSIFVLCVAMALVWCGLSWAGFGANHLDIAPNYASILLGISNTVGTIPGIISPIVTSVFVRLDKKDERYLLTWSPVFLLMGFIVIGASAIYFIFGSAKIQDWADGKPKRKVPCDDPACKSCVEIKQFGY